MVAEELCKQRQERSVHAVTSPIRAALKQKDRSVSAVKREGLRMNAAKKTYIKT
ncbi:hypothetical protein DPMN_155058 [Dreissena polymorpha]|uniref:Uncharacterized protein n=1 Tax=Dreissena polymorpha TaxID=45954 RepID=A0A9D4JAJ5_DREPO|nr:hypothetical protein DPMN_155058 [Dreissena polymorpha]